MLKNDFFIQRIEARKKTLAELETKALNSDDVEEVRHLFSKIKELREEMAELEGEMKTIENLEGKEERSTIPEGARLINGMQGGAFVQRGGENLADDMYATKEYRMAFKNYVQRGDMIPAKFEKRDFDGIGPINTQDLGAIIPTTIMTEFISEVEKVYGQLYNKVRKLNVRGGVKIPLVDLGASFKWITESTVSPRQDIGEAKNFVEFSYNIGEIRVSQTLLSSIVSLDLFEREIVRVMTQAYLEAMDKGIISGTGQGQMLGILNDERIANNTKNIIELTATEFNNWTMWRKKLFAKLPVGRRNGEFIFAASTVESYLMTMADSNNNPIFYQAADVRYDDLRNPSYGRFFGRDVTVVEPDVLADFDTANVGDVVGIYWIPEQYAINTNLQFGFKKYFDEERNEWVHKALTILDGKPLNPNAFYLIKKKATPPTP